MFTRRPVAHMAVVAGAIWFASVACGSSSDSGAPGDGGIPDGAAADGESDGGRLPDGAPGEASTQAPDGAVCGTGACTGVAGACGTIVDACGQKVACEPCRYTADAVPAGGEWVALAVAPSGAPSIAIGANGIQLATKSGASWQLEKVAPQGDGGSIDLFGLDMAFAPDGTPWVAYTDLSGGSAHVAVARRSGGAWTIDAWSGVAIAVAIASDGTPYVAYAGADNGQVGGKFGVVLASYSGGAWNRTLISASSLVRGVALAMRGTEPHVAWHDDSVVRYAAPNAGSSTVEEVVTFSSQGVGVDLSLALDNTGRPHIAAYWYGSVVHAVRDGAWTHDNVMGALGNGPVRVAASSSSTGAVAVAAIDDVANDLTAAFSARPWSLQTLFARCNSGKAHMDMDFDPAGALIIAHTCAANGIGVLTQTGIYPPGFASACDTIVSTLCKNACACPLRADGDCCVAGACMSPPSYCPTAVSKDFCGSATVDPQAVFGCRDTLPQTTCNPDGGVGAIEPRACDALRN
jgi:hypothetical protein